MKTILGLLKADSGEIIVGGEKVVYGQTSTNQYIGYLPDVPEFYPFMTATEHLRFCGEITGMKKAECDDRCKELLALVGLSDEKHRIKGFSRGMPVTVYVTVICLKMPVFETCSIGAIFGKVVKLCQPVMSAKSAYCRNGIFFL